MITGGPGARRAYARLVTRTTRLTVVLLLNLALVAGLVVAGIGAHSIGVLAAGGDYLADAAAIGISLLAIGLARRAVLLDTLADSAAAAGVAVTGAVLAGSRHRPGHRGRGRLPRPAAHPRGDHHAGA